MNQLRHAWLPVLCALSAIISLWLGWGGKIHPLNAPYDSLRYLGMAESIMRGDWLGPYNYLTLFRQPVYPVFIAVNGWLGFPLHITQQAAYLGALSLLLVALRHCGLSKWKTGLFFVFGAFHPIAFYPHMFVITEAFYTTTTIAVMAGCIGLWGTLGGHSSWRFFLWLAVLSISLSLFWHMRGESVWILPALIFFYLSGLRSLYRSRGDLGLHQAWLRFVCIIIFPLLTTMTAGLIFATLNKAYYGVDVVHELADPAFAEAGKLLASIEAGERIPHVPVSQAALEKAYTVSADFALLKPYFSNKNNWKLWTIDACNSIQVCDEIVGTWMVFAVRDAVNSIGAYQSATKAHNFYAHVASDLHAACEQGRITCSPNPTGNLFYPPISLGDLSGILYSFLRMGRQFVTMDSSAAVIRTITHIPNSPQIIAQFSKVTHDQNGKIADELFPITTHFLIFRILQLLGFVLVMVFILRLPWQAHEKRLAQFGLAKFGLAIGSFLTLLICSRIGLLATIDAISWPIAWADRFRYLLEAYPAFLLLCILVLPDQRDSANKYRANAVDNYANRYGLRMIK